MTGKRFMRTEFSSSIFPRCRFIDDDFDPDHFDKNYFGKGFRWQLPDLETSERGYRMANEAYLKAGRQILDATVGGMLQVFPKVDYDKLFL